MEPKTTNYLEIALKLWPVLAIFLSLVVQWAIFGQRVTSLEERVERQGTAITSIRDSLQETQTQYAALNAKVDGIKGSVDYLVSRIDRAIKD